MTHPFDITVTSHGTGKVAVDGVDLSNSTAGFTLDAAVGQVPTLTLDVLLRGGGHVSGEAAVVVDEATTALLESLGWTPPDIPELPPPPASGAVRRPSPF